VAVACACRATRSARDAAEQGIADALVARLEAGGFTPPDVAELARVLDVPRERLAEYAQRLERDGALVRASADLWFSPPAIEAARDLIRRHAAIHGQIDAASFRDLIRASRKFSIALLTYFDRTGFTLRIGDVRKVRQTLTPWTTSSRRSTVLKSPTSLPSSPRRRGPSQFLGPPALPGVALTTTASRQTRRGSGREQGHDWVPAFAGMTE
jgi:hypothetical protein